MIMMTMTAEDAVKQVIGTYIESMEKSSGDMVTEAFHENAKLWAISMGISCTFQHLISLDSYQHRSPGQWSLKFCLVR